MKKRKEILPKWIRFFAWIFLFFGIAPVIFLIGLTGKASINVTVFGLEYSGYSSLNPIVIWGTVIFSMAATVSYGILWGKSWAINLAIVYAILALSTNAFAVVFRLTKDELYIPLEPLVLIPFLVVLIRKKDEWKRFPQMNTPEVEPVAVVDGSKLPPTTL